MRDVNIPVAPMAAGASISHVVPVPRTRRPGRQAVRRRLLDAALAVFAERGYANASLDQVATAAGLTKGAIYSNFASKDDLFFALMTEQIVQRADAIQSALSAHAAEARGPEALQDIGRQLTRAFTTQRSWQLVFFDFWRLAMCDESVRIRFVAHRRMVRAAIAARVEQSFGSRPTPSRFSVDDVVTIVLALCNGLAIEQYIDPDLVSDGLLGRILSSLAQAD